MLHNLKDWLRLSLRANCPKVCLIVSSVMLFCLIGSSPPLLASSEVGDGPLVNIPAVANGIDLAPYLHYWHDKNEPSGLAQAQQAFQLGQFSLLQSAIPNLGFSAGSHWFTVTLKNGVDESRQLYLEIDYPILDELDLHCFSSLGFLRFEYKGGDSVEYQQRLVKVRNYLFPLTMEPSEILHCFIRVGSTSNIILPIRVYDTIAYFERSEFVDRNLGVVYGIALALMLYSLIQLVAIGDRMYVYFLLHVMTGVWFLTLMDGSLAELWISLGLQNVAMPVALALTSASFVCFTIEFLEIRSFNSVWHWLGKILVGLNLAMVLALVFVSLRWTLAGISALILVECLYSIGVGIHRWMGQYRLAIIYLTGFASLFVVVIWIVLNLFGIEGDVRWVIYGGHVAWICELFVLSLAMGMRARSLEKEHLELGHRMKIIERINSTKTDFIAKLSHEIRIPANGVLGMVELLFRTPIDKTQRHYLETIRNAGNALLSVTHDVVDHSQLDSGQVACARHRFNLQILLEEIFAIYEYDLLKKKISLEGVIDIGTPLDLVGDDIKIRQVLLNLVLNAIKFTEFGGVSVSVSLTDRIHNDNLILRFQVSDTGVGVAQADRTKLFQRSSQLRVESDYNQPSLGLAISKQLVEFMGGEMGVKTELGKGACFWFDLPVEFSEHTSVAEQELHVSCGLSINEETPAIIPDNNSLVATNSESKLVDIGCERTAKLLVVEDNPINQNVIVEFLKKLQLVADVVDNGQQAFDKVKQADFDYDLILMDCETPVMNGYDSAVNIRQWQEQNNRDITPIIALSAHTLKEYRDLAIEAGMVDFISKPITLKTLRDQLALHITVPEL